MSTTTNHGVLTLERRGHVLLMGINRAEKRNAFTIELLMSLGRAYEQLERDDDLRCGVLFAHGEHFTAGLDLAEVGPALAEGTLTFPPDARDPRNDGKPWTTPVIAAAQGWCMTLGIELLLASDIRIAGRDVRFAQLEVQRGIYPFGGATIRLPRGGLGQRHALAAHRRRIRRRRGAPHRSHPGNHRTRRSPGPRHRAGGDGMVP